MCARLNKFLSYRKCIQETGTGCIHIVTESVGDATFIADNIGCSREHHIGGNGSTNHQVNFFGCGMGFCKQLFHSLGAHVRCTHSFAFKDMALTDPDTGHDPFVGGIHHAA